MSLPLFRDILPTLAGGAFHEQCTEAMAAVVRAALQSGEVGTLTLTLKVTPGGASDGRRLVALHGSLKASCPRAKLPGTEMIADEEGGLSPEQPPLPGLLTRAPAQTGKGN